MNRIIFDDPTSEGQKLELLNCLDKCLNIQLAVDLETYDPDGGLKKNKKGLCPHLGKIRLWQLQPQGGDTYVIKEPPRGAESDYPLFSLTTTRFLDDDRIKQKLKQILEDKRTCKILHNGLFDAAWFKILYDIEIQGVYDTMIASQVIYCGASVRHGLGYTVERFLGKSIDKSMQTSDWGTHKLNDEQIEYACTDVEILHKLKEAQIIKAFNANMLETVMFQLSCFNLFLGMTTTGFYADPEEIKQFRLDYAHWIGHYEGKIIQQLQPLSEHKLTATSPANKLVPVILQLYPSLKTTDFSTETAKGLSLSKQVLNNLNKKEYPIIQDFIKYRTLTSISKYSRAMDAGFFNGRVTGTFRVLASNGVGRSSSGQWFTKCGINFQNPNKPLDDSGLIPSQLKEEHNLKDLKQLLKAPPGKKLLIFDFSAAHARIAADLGYDRTLIKVYSEGLDSHCMMISQLAKPFHLDQKYGHLSPGFTWSFKEVITALEDKKHPLNPIVKLIRKAVAKTVFYLGLNGGGKGRAYSAINERGFEVSLEDAGVIVQAWRSTYAGLWNFLTEMMQKLRSEPTYSIGTEKYKKYVVPRINQARWLPLFSSTFSDKLEPKLNDAAATNWLMIEGVALKLAQKQFTRIASNNPQWNAKMLVNAHDEYVVEINEQYAYSGAIAGQHCRNMGLQPWLDLVSAGPMEDPNSFIADTWSEK